MDSSDTPMRYQGPLDLAHAHTKLNHVTESDEGFTRDGPRADNEYRDLGLAAASGGRIGAKHIRAIRPFGEPTGWHWHDMTGHFVVILKGWITFRFAGVEGDVTVKAGSYVMLAISDSGVGMDASVQERLFEPWTMSDDEQAAAGCVIGRDYPAPIVERRIRQTQVSLPNR